MIFITLLAGRENPEPDEVPDDPEPPAPDRYAVNFPNGSVKLSAAEWQTVKTKTGKYAKLLS